MKLTFFKGTLFGLASGMALGLAGTVYASYGINPHYTVSQPCLTAVEHLMNPADVGAALNAHFPQGAALKHGSGSPLLNAKAGTNYTSFLHFMDDVREHYNLPRLDTSGADHNGILGEHVMEGLCVE